MYPYEKQNLVPYRWLVGAALILFVSAVGLGILFRKPLGVWLFLIVLLSCVPIVRGLLSWNSEPTAKRQFGTALAVSLLYAVVCLFTVDPLIAKYHLMRGECPIWMDFSGRCFYPYPGQDQADGGTIPIPQLGQAGSGGTETVRAVPPRPS